jgi:protein-tyrosine phosphatase
MIPLVDTHCHLLAGLDDGPQSDDEALCMCEDALRDGIQMAAALAHQNPYYPEVTPHRIRTATQRLAAQLRAEEVALTVFPCAEIMFRTDLDVAWQQGELLSIGDHCQYVLLEMPHREFVDLREMAERLEPMGVRPVIAHAERYPELLHTPGLVEEWIEAGFVVQVSSPGIVNCRRRGDLRAVKKWFQRGIVHVLGSDGHHPDRRPPQMSAAYRQIVQWVGEPTADRICSTNGMALLQGLPLRIAPPRPAGWLARFW